jgi:4-nitrophenyl phosphatase
MKGVILDIDGVLRRGGSPIRGSIEAVDKMIDSGLRLYLLSNNSTRTHGELSDEIEAMGFPSLDVVNSAYAASVYVAENFGKSSCLLLGEEGLAREFEETGHMIYKAGDEFRWDNIKEYEVPDVDVTVAGMDRSLNYNKIAHALYHLRKGVTFVATNDDPTFPVEEGNVIPGAGSAVAPLKYCSGIEPFVAGKPNDYSTRITLELMKLEPEDVLVIGDRPDTDMAAGLSAGCRVARVLTGDVKEISKEDYPLYPDLLSLVEGELF